MASWSWDKRWLYEQMMADDAREREWDMEQRRQEQEANADTPQGADGGGGGAGGGASAAKRQERIDQGINPAVARHSKVAAPRDN